MARVHGGGTDVVDTALFLLVVTYVAGVIYLRRMA